MFNRPNQQIRQRVESLRSHLSEENPVLVEAMKSFLKLDGIAYKMGLLSRDESFATHISWWPLISILGTFSAGKSTFINQYLGKNLQKTGNQAVDDKFTVVCYSQDNSVRVLPGLALDADPRFPFYQISEEIERVASGEGARINTYLQLKTCPSEILRGKILIDSPGFDADSQRTSTLRITDHIIDLSDLVLVFFDARHPEPGAMKDTLQHLVANTVRRNDANKLLFILNQIDTTALDDNVEDVVAAWQRALAQGGLVSGRFYSIYDEQSAVQIDDEALKRRYQTKRDVDLAEIKHRISEVSVERVYRIIGSLENTANEIENTAIPRLKEALSQWTRRVLIFDAIFLIPLLTALAVGGAYAGYWQGLNWAALLQGGESLLSSIFAWLKLLGPVVVVVLVVHFFVRSWQAVKIAGELPTMEGPGSLRRAFLKNTRFWRSIARPVPVGWTVFSRKSLKKVRESADQFVQKLNDTYTNPSGTGRSTSSAGDGSSMNTQSAEQAGSQLADASTPVERAVGEMQRS